MAESEEQASVQPEQEVQHEDIKSPEEPIEETKDSYEQIATDAQNGEHQDVDDGVPEEAASPEEAPPPPAKDSEDGRHIEEPVSSLPASTIPQTPPQETPPPVPAPDTPRTLPSRPRTDSQSTTATNATRNTARSTRSSMVFVVQALESIAASKDARKRKALADSTQRALSAIRSAQGDASQINPEVLFEPLNLATEASTVTVVITALDCIGKLISYSYFSAPPPAAEPPRQSADGALPPPQQRQQAPLIERAIDTICDCFQGEATPSEVQMQIIKSLLAAILNDKIIVHGAGLLKSVRQTYNIFLLSKSSANQQIAQGTLTQMVGTVFERVKTRLGAQTVRMNSSKSSLEAAASTNGDHDAGVNGTSTPAEGDETPTVADGESETAAENDGDSKQKMTLQTFETRKSFDDTKLTDTAPTTVTRTGRPSRSAQQGSRNTSGHDIPAITVQNGEIPDSVISEDDEEDEIYVKDAFLVFRAMCKLSTKPLRKEDAVDIKSQGMRSKLLSLHIIHTVLFNHSIVFTSPHATIKSSGSGEPTGFTQAIKQYLCLSLSRNGASSVQRVFEVAAEIFSLMLRHLRAQLKRELEVFLKEIYLAILDKRAAPNWQKQYIVSHIFAYLGSDPKVLVEIYLNYDCDRNALDNMYQRIIEHPAQVNGLQQQAYQDHVASKKDQTASGGSDWRERGTLPPSLATANMGGSSATQAMFQDEGFPLEYAMKMQALECLVEVLRSLVRWGQQGMASAAAAESSLAAGDMEGRGSSEELRESIDTRGGEMVGTPTTTDGSTLASGNSYFTGTVPDTPVVEDDPAELEKVKARKTALNNAIRQFNFKPKRGIKLLISDGFIPSSDPRDIGRFLISNDRLNKKALGEFLGEGDDENIKIMHAFVDSMEFARTRFVDALRKFLQSFRLPGEAQKIDRLMLKFAERYTSGNPNAFANADTAYVLSYSVIMLNTDQHSAQVKNRMTVEDFIKNNRGINDNANLPDEYLQGIYNEIREHEIVLDTERETEANLRGAVPANDRQGGLASVVGNLGRDLQREAYAAASEEMSNRTEQLFRSLLRAQKRGGIVTGLGGPAVGKASFLTASSFRHIGPMFEVTWMGFLTALSGSAQETQNLETIRLCMEGQKLAIRIACLFDLQDPRQAFVGSLARSTNLYNLVEMKAKNVEALKALLEVAQTEGNLLKESWRDVLTCVSQLDRFQLISSGVEEGAVPDVMRSQTMGHGGQTPSRKSMQVPRRPTSRAPGSSASGNYQLDIAEESRSADMIRGVDRIFTNTANLSGEAIVHFVRALTQVSWQEIQSSGQSDSPRTYSLQKLVEISGYNMLRVRFEWTNIWQVLGQHFIDVGCHNNTHVVYFALNSLRQLSMRFMEIEELPGFKFQKDFLKPFELILGTATQVAVKDMVLRCLIQMIQARGDMIRSGWRTMFGVFTVAAKEPYESIVNLAFDNVTQVYNDRFGVVISQGAFADLVVCLTEFSKNMKFQKKSLQAIETLRSSVPKMLRTPECPLSQRAAGEKEKPQAEGMPKQPSRQTQEEQFWFPVLFAFHDVLMTGEDLEVRSRALNYLFDTLTKYGGDFPRDFWDTLWRQLLYPIFMVLKDRKALNQDAINHEELSVWLSTTLIQALRNMISLFTHFFESLEYMLDRFLDLLALCICQENDTLARIGSNCLQQLILQNVKKFSPEHWEKIVGAFVDLFARTEARELFSAATNSAYERRGSSYGNGNGNGAAETPKTASVMTGHDAPSASNALRINGLPQESSAEVSTVNGDSRPPTLRTEDSNSLSMSDETSPSRAPPTTNTKPSDLEDFASAPASQHQAPIIVTAARRRYFNQIITKCVLQLLMIETVSELFNNDAVYASIPSPLLLRLMALLKKSYHFAKRFNDDRDLRTRLFREGFMKQPPNLLKQESGSASVYVLILLRMYADTSSDRAASRPETEAALIPLCTDILTSFVSLDEETQQRNIATWRPVVVDVLEGYTSGFPAEDFARHVETFAPLAVGLMGREMGGELQKAVQGFWGRVCEVNLGLGKMEIGGPTPVSPRASSGVFGGRRGSRAAR
ncbi:guanine nucleotide exchange protein for ADP-robosylation factor [Saxophila tyrrhenica]|uniref:Guanine nucleotide exchange protein for ADP-robosylation factor n=1 Tax=Saxophila tyrrhenica TaxID=1690608 RepID=A0AAV9PPV0_9PEZI|nr:guanine nucleotide exchange protein for ADP-robosylation factor [Saxophila tyrrhenica]